MPRKAKEKESIIEKEKNNNNVKNNLEKNSSKKIEKVTSSKKASSTNKKIENEKVSSKSSREKSKNLAKKDDLKKSNTPKTKTTTKKTNTKVTTKKRVSAKPRKNTSKNVNHTEILEYYDLPYKYENTTIKLLAQTPKTLFAYWNVSDTDIDNFKKSFGENFLYNSTPFLIVHNFTLNETFEIEINDFANCWYINVSNSNCEFNVKLARKFNNNLNKNDYLQITESNHLQSPNDHILFEKLNSFVNFKNVETGDTIVKNISSFTFLEDLYKFYKDLYNDEFIKNPSSNTFI